MVEVVAEVLDNKLGGREVDCWLDVIKFKFLSGLGDRTFVEPEVKTVEMLLVVLELQEVGGLETSCLVGSIP